MHRVVQIVIKLVWHHLEILSKREKIKSCYLVQNKDLQLGIRLENMLSDLKQFQHSCLTGSTKSTPLDYLHRDTFCYMLFDTEATKVHTFIGIYPLS